MYTQRDINSNYNHEQCSAEIEREKEWRRVEKQVKDHFIRVLKDENEHFDLVFSKRSPFSILWTSINFCGTETCGAYTLKESNEFGRRNVKAFMWEKIYGWNHTKKIAFLSRLVTFTFARILCFRLFIYFSLGFCSPFCVVDKGNSLWRLFDILFRVHRCHYDVISTWYFMSVGNDMFHVVLLQEKKHTQKKFVLIRVVPRRKKKLMKHCFIDVGQCSNEF